MQYALDVCITQMRYMTTMGICFQNIKTDSDCLWYFINEKRIAVLFVASVASLFFLHDFSVKPFAAHVG